MRTYSVTGWANHPTHGLRRISRTVAMAPAAAADLYIELATVYRDASTARGFYHWAELRSEQERNNGF